MDGYFIVAAGPQERDSLRVAFPDSCIIVPGNQFHGNYNIALVAMNVDDTSEWFEQHVRGSLVPGAKIYTLMEAGYGRTT